MRNMLELWGVLLCWRAGPGAWLDDDVRRGILRNYVLPAGLLLIPAIHHATPLAHSTEGSC